MKTVQEVIKELEKLVKKDSKSIRSKIKQLCHRLLNDEFDSYVLLPCVIQDTIDDLFVMDEIEGRKEPKILHMHLNEVKQVLQKLKATVDQYSA